ncbi:hypothetical protein CD034_03235 [Staphylococcus hominis subsp. hominis]|uniref:hypothetical protein n=1 Tax=Staphylococcus hominis TaxID=1290 RepID=UPI000CD190C2|nr:hypothetical protein [Staphylococcus hominis]AYY65681.1 hypothetical protein EGX58_01635 [Staphylococcus hominis]PNZ32580.1 hypothetical protein CD034_03235 [Staphylococcus hominis subsp. hominis]SUM42077.1 Uncharacterised protein [Staphylococcus hominis]
MLLVYWLPVIILFLMWAYTLYKWIKTERELNQSREEIQRYQEEELKKDENNLLNNLKLEGPITQELSIDKTKRKFGERHKIDASSWLDKQKENGSIPIKQSFVLKGKSGRYFQDILTVFSEHALSEKVMETTDDILKAKKYSTHKEANDEAIKYDFKVMALNTYVKEL